MNSVEWYNKGVLHVRLVPVPLGKVSKIANACYGFPGRFAKQTLYHAGPLSSVLSRNESDHEWSPEQSRAFNREWKKTLHLVCLEVALESSRHQR